MPSRRAVLAGLAGGTVGSLAGCVSTAGPSATPGTDSDTDWPMFGADRLRSGYVPSAAAPRSAPSERFTASLEGTPIGQPIVADGTVFQSTWYGIEAFDAADGESLWRFRDEEPGDTAVQYQPPAVHDGIAYVGTESGLVALDAGSGEVRWRVETDSRVSAPPVAGYDWNHLYVGTIEGTLLDVVLEEGSSEPPGTVQWTKSVYGEIVRLVASNVAGVTAGTSGGEVFMVYDGRGLWRTKVPGGVTAMTAERGNSLYVATFGGGVLKLRTAAHAGRVSWHTEDGPVAQGLLVRAAGGVYGADGGGLTALGTDGGKERWTVDDAASSVPAAAGDTLYIAGEDSILAYKFDGGTGVGGARIDPRRWEYTHDGGYVSGVSVADGAVFAAVGDGDQRILALE
ncbi:PQQ-binding-like beta-propeller repeat protein [Halobaculum magnesiiphilum]|uniref:PQQ-binding-like beta-propeller repeat protein n=1 Tax=Halobaculum magnesiiphilum TaxID=1017351 RepID=A0A8T8WJ48_9EURY|nr:PQQ-binding-like beta-propeller repeat protein [Halobaculum magnesiiphilum]QZP39733.1 PQQ-binding-like beta-propeller repeat protein [Halobaculum magnesiiphilum]